MKPVAGMNIDEAALKAGISDSEIMEIADRWFCTGENQHRSDGYYYRSLGTPTNVRGSDLIEFARALLHRSQPVAVVPAEQAEDSAMLDWLESQWQDGIHVELCATNDGLTVHGLRPAATVFTRIDETKGSSIREAIRAAIGRNREAGGS